ncbi:MAG: serine hydrolase domain-containing protein [Arenimonas sp.]
MPYARSTLSRHRAGACLALLAAMLAFAPAALAADAPDSTGKGKAVDFTGIDRIFADYAKANHIPGVVYGVVKGGKLVHVGSLGVQDVASRRPVTADTLFRIASMTKAFTALTILELRDEGKLRLDEPVETYVPELREWKYPTVDSPRVRVRDLLTHTAGFVTDDPWGDRQTPMPEAEFTQLLRDGVPFTSAPGTRMEYSNFGYALLGRVITNVSGRPFADTITGTLLQPLGMDASGFVADAAPRKLRALGYRWEDDTWRPEPTLAHGAFGAMGGVQASANDYAKWVAFLLSAWPPRDDAQAGPVASASVRELAQGSGFATLRARFGSSGATACKQAATYGMGMFAADDCDLGLTLSHGGGYPGYGSHVLLLPDHDVGIFALTNRTYGRPSGAVWDAAVALMKAGFLEPRAQVASAELADAYRAVSAIYAKGGITAVGDVLAMNMLLDRDAASWHRDLALLRAKLGDCDTTAPVKPSGALSGTFSWACARGVLEGNVLLAPTHPPRIQALELLPAGL